MFLRLFRNAVSESESGLADRGPAVPEGPEKISADGGVHAGNDSGGVTTTDVAPEGTLGQNTGDSPKRIATV